MGMSVPPEALLFPSKDGVDTLSSENVAEATLDDCPAKVRMDAEKLCKAMNAKEDATATKELVDACIFDVCFGGDSFADEDAATQQIVKETA